jgi:hypothetical protein
MTSQRFGFRVSGSVLLQLNWQAASTAATATIPLFAVLFGSHSVVIRWFHITDLFYLSIL